MEKFMSNVKSSAGSSTDESDPDKGKFDVEGYNLQEHKKFSVIKATRNKDNYAKEQPRRRRVSRCPGGEGLNTERSSKENTEYKNKNKHSNNNNNNNKRKHKKAKEKFIDLNVYSFRIPQYNSEGEMQQPTYANEDEGKAQSKKKKVKVKKLKTRKALDKSYNRCHEWYKTIPKKPVAEHPSASIPSFKAQWRSLNIQQNTVQRAMNKVLEQTFQAIDDIERIKLRKEATHNAQFILLQLADDVVGEIEEQQQRHAVRYAIEVLLDKWEGAVYQTRKSMVEDQLDQLSELVVKEAISKVSFEVENEDRVASLVVRDALASSMDHLSQKRTKIQNRLHKIFHEYHFDDFDFDRGETVIRQKVHRTRRDLDVYLEKRKHLVQHDEKNENEEHKERRRKKRNERDKARKKKKKDEIVDNLEEIQEEEKENNNNNNENMKIEESEEEDLSQRKLIALPEEHLSDGEEANASLVRPSVTRMNKVSQRQSRRSQVLRIWRETDSNTLSDIRKENEKWNSFYETKQIEEEKAEEEKLRKLEEANNSNDLNAMYADEEEAEKKKEEEGEFDSDEVNFDDTVMPNLNLLVEKALDDHEADIVVAPVKQVFKIAPPSDDSAVESDGERSDGEGETSPKEKDEKIKVDEIPLEKPEAIIREDTGFASIPNDELEAYDMEKVYSVQDFIDMIPNLDRNQYLNDWLIQGSKDTSVTQNNNRLPTPPSKGRNTNTRPRRFHLKRPGTAESTVSVRDVVPLEDHLLSQYRGAGRLNSAKSTRSNNRPESAFSLYSERSSVHSRLDDRASSIEMESDEEEKMALKPTNQVTKNTKIEFTKPEENESRKNETFEKELESSAWNFYLRQNRDLRKLQEKIEKDGAPQRFEDCELPSADFADADLNAILEKYGNVEINGMYDGISEDEEEEIELLRLANDKGGSSSDEEENDDKKVNAPSISPPSTPWKRQKHRPLTPDSVDSDEELEKIKRRHYNMYQEKNQGPKKERLYKEYLKKKDTSLPPPPKLGWQPPTQGLIKWKTAAVGKLINVFLFLFEKIVVRVAFRFQMKPLTQF